MAPGIVLSEDAYARMSRAVQAYESSQGGRRVGALPDSLTHVRCSSSTPTSGLYPGIVTQRDPDTGLWSDVADADVKMLDLNGNPLLVDVRYECVPCGATTAGLTVMLAVSIGSPPAAAVYSQATLAGDFTVLAGVSTPSFSAANPTGLSLSITVPGTYLLTTGIAWGVITGDIADELIADLYDSTSAAMLNPNGDPYLFGTSNNVGVATKGYTTFQMVCTFAIASTVQLRAGYFGSYSAKTVYGNSATHSKGPPTYMSALQLGIGGGGFGGSGVTGLTGTYS